MARAWLYLGKGTALITPVLWRRAKLSFLLASYQPDRAPENPIFRDKSVEPANSSSLARWASRLSKESELPQHVQRFPQS
jgi:hypothetical protein